MPRFALPLVAALLPALAAANAPPPDRFAPCQGLQAGAACFGPGCACVSVADPDCPGGTTPCLSCETAQGGWCGTNDYQGPDGGGCASGPATAFAAGALGLAFLLRARRPRARR